jgi:flavodoxin
MGMRPLIIYISFHHGNTEIIARAIAESLGAELVLCPDIDIEALTRYDLIGFGSGIYFGQHHRSLLALAEQLPAAHGKSAFIFSTAGYPRLMTRWHGALKERLQKKGYTISGEYCCKGFDTYGPFRFIGGINKGRPNENDIIAAKSFARDLKMERGI